MAASDSPFEEVHAIIESSNTTSHLQTNWSLCIFCQESRNEKLTCPGESKRQDAGVGYSTLADDLIGFHQIGKLPTSLKLSLLDDGSGVCTTLTNHKAQDM